MAAANSGRLRGMTSQVAHNMRRLLLLIQLTIGQPLPHDHLLLLLQTPWPKRHAAHAVAPQAAQPCQRFGRIAALQIASSTQWRELRAGSGQRERSLSSMGISDAPAQGAVALPADSNSSSSH